MEINWETIVTIASMLGGWETIKYFLNRKANRTLATANAALAQAEADKAEVAVEHDQFDLFKEINTHLQEGLARKDEVIASKDRIIEDKDRIIAEKDRAFSEQTTRLRNTQDSLNEALKSNTELKAQFIYADTWRCEVGECKKRKPPKPQLYGLEYDVDKMPITNKTEQQ